MSPHEKFIIKFFAIPFFFIAGFLLTFWAFSVRAQEIIESFFTSKIEIPLEKEILERNSYHYFKDSDGGVVRDIVPDSDFLLLKFRNAGQPEKKGYVYTHSTYQEPTYSTDYVLPTKDEYLIVSSTTKDIIYIESDLVEKVISKVEYEKVI